MEGLSGPNLTSDVHILHLWLTPGMIGAGSEGDLGLTGTELVLHALWLCRES